MTAYDMHDKLEQVRTTLICADSRVLKGRSLCHLHDYTVFLGSQVQYSTCQDSDVAHGVVSMGTEAA